MEFCDEPLAEGIRRLERALACRPPGEVLERVVLDPDLGAGRFAGETLRPCGPTHRPWSVRPTSVNDEDSVASKRPAVTPSSLVSSIAIASWASMAPAKKSGAPTPS